MNDVEELARWLHRTACRLRGRLWLSRGVRPIAWAQVSESRRDDYRAVARELLTNPPAVLFTPVVVVGLHEGKSRV